MLSDRCHNNLYESNSCVEDSIAHWGRASKGHNNRDDRDSDHLGR